ncbi:SAM-dependent methyltransferase [Micromonospora okii]|uniref:SAM-dependent methyltransferase n=1 Tax=Micromonospora okii TaxID=1182970 RepID=UPI001E60913B|nr:class I SAM-dependent methyltransferase [Micromonospora okii]
MLPTDDPDAVRYARMRWNTPLSQEHADLLLDRLAVPAGARVLDLGCGWGELLLRAVAGGTSTTSPVDPTTGVGVDTDADALARGRRLAAERGLDQRVTFVEGAAATWSEPADRVLCLGASHALGGTGAALDALAGLVRPGGRLLLGEGYWERPPTPEAVRVFGTGVLDLAGLVEQVRASGWRVLSLTTTEQREWDDFESTWRAGRQEWLLAHPDHPRAGEVREELDARLREYVGVYRGVLGLAYLVLGR